jgi:hypothetical protein
MIIVVAWALVIWLVILLAFGPDLFQTLSGRKSRAEPAEPANAATRKPAAR